MVQIVATECESWEKPILKKALKGHKITFIDEPLSKQNIKKAKSAQILITFIYSQISKDLLKQMPKLKAIATMSTGFDHIDTSYCKKNKIAVSNVPYYGENTVAEHTMALILSVSRKIPQSIERTRKGDFSLEELRGFDLKNKTLGVLGGGSIGMHVVKMARAFEMKVLVCDKFKDKKKEKELGFKYASLNATLKNSNILTIHLPLIPSTHHIINKKNIKNIKKGAVLINTARGGIVETGALLKALDKKIISYAALDVLEGECDIKEERQLLSKEFKKTCDLKTLLQDHLLLNNPNVFITPHNAFNSKEAIRRILNTTIDNVKAFIKKKPINVVKNNK